MKRYGATGRVVLPGTKGATDMVLGDHGETRSHSGE